MTLESARGPLLLMLAELFSLLRLKPATNPCRLRLLPPLPGLCCPSAGLSPRLSSPPVVLLAALCCSFSRFLASFCSSFSAFLLRSSSVASERRIASISIMSSKCSTLLRCSALEGLGPGTTPPLSCAPLPPYSPSTLEPGEPCACPPVPPPAGTAPALPPPVWLELDDI